MMVVGALGIGSATAVAEPSAPDGHTVRAEIMPGVHYTGNTLDQSVVIETGAATLITQGGLFQVRDAAGNVVGGNAFAVEPAALKAAAAPAAAAPDMGLDDIDVDPHTERFNEAIEAAVNEFGLATGVGTMAGGLIGLAAGCGIGAVAGAVFGAPVLDAGGLTVIAGCLAGAAVLGGMGAIIGAALLGVPVAVAAAIQFQNTMNQPYESPHGHDD
ncbi:hypothetical protein [Nocardia mexicana]|uniref:hypothetical protein n=1 Tax=Nocardia mexicana TaxID=279262 RepID=UPI0011C07447|nr:hypothetical protein [Nocardia mexicana]